MRAFSAARGSVHGRASGGRSSPFPSPIPLPPPSNFFPASVGPRPLRDREEGTARLLDSAGPSGGRGSVGGTKELIPRAIDADDTDDEDAGGGEEEDDDDDDDDEDDTAALLAELEKIKRERADEAARKAALENAAAEKARQQEVAAGNPLLALAGGTGGGAAGGSFSVKRRWDEDVVFKNQTRGEPKHVKRFVNDTIRSDFHRRFLSRYIR